MTRCGITLNSCPKTKAISPSLTTRVFPYLVSLVDHTPQFAETFPQFFYAANVIVVMVGEKYGLRCQLLAAMAFNTGSASPGSTTGSDLLHHSKPRCNCHQRRETVKIHRLPLSVKRKVVMKPAESLKLSWLPIAGAICPGESLSQGAGAPAQPVVH